MLTPVLDHSNLLTRRDPAPVEWVNEDGASDVLLVCEHAGRAVPAALGDLGVAAPDMDRHIAWDVGADGLARRLSAELDAPLVLQAFSRLVVDCNRPFEAADCFVAVSDGTAVPGNAGIDERERRRRFEEIHRPFHEAIARVLDRRGAAGRKTILVAVHSFTPKLAGGEPRPWHVGALSNRDHRFARALLDALPAVVAAAHNEPYQVDDLSDYTIPVHGEARGIPHVLVEVRHDLIADRAGQQHWGGLLAAALQSAARGF